MGNAVENFTNVNPAHLSSYVITKYIVSLHIQNYFTKTHQKFLAKKKNRLL